MQRGCRLNGRVGNNTFCACASVPVMMMRSLLQRHCYFLTGLAFEARCMLLSAVSFNAFKYYILYLSRPSPSTHGSAYATININFPAVTANAAYTFSVNINTRLVHRKGIRVYRVQYKPYYMVEVYARTNNKLHMRIGSHGHKKRVCHFALMTSK